jgi:hypothetical protein
MPCRPAATPTWIIVGLNVKVCRTSDRPQPWWTAAEWLMKALSAQQQRKRGGG